MKKFALFIDRPDYDIAFSPIVGMLLNKKLITAPLRTNKRRKIDWNLVVTEPEFNLELQDCSIF